jgi:hypothetical protein
MLKLVTPVSSWNEGNIFNVYNFVNSLFKKINYNIGKKLTNKLFGQMGQKG